MRIILNVIWLLLCGLWMAIFYILAGVLAFVLIITIPFGIAAFRIAGYVLWPFGRTIEPRDDAGAGALIGNIIWIIVFGWWLALGHLVTGVLLCLTIIGIPLGIANFKIIPISLVPLGIRVVSTARRLFMRHVVAGIDIDGDDVAVLAVREDLLHLIGADAELRVRVVDRPADADAIGEDALEVTALGEVGHSRVPDIPCGLRDDRRPRPVGGMRLGLGEHAGLRSKYFRCSGWGVGDGWCVAVRAFGPSSRMPAPVSDYRQ